LDIAFSHNALEQRYLIAEQAELLKRTKYRMRVMRMCVQCQAHPIPDKTCDKCGANAVWQSRIGKACRRCGFHSK